MTCEEYERLLVSLAAGELEDSEAAEVMDHVAQCRECRKALGDIKALFARAKRELTLDAPDGLVPEILKAAGGRHRRPRAWRVPLWAAAAAVVVAALACGIFGYREGKAERGAVKEEHAGRAAVLEERTLGFWQAGSQVPWRIKAAPASQDGGRFWESPAAFDRFLEKKREG